MREGKIGVQETVSVITASTVAKLMFTEHTVLRDGGNGSWQSSIFAGILVLLMFAALLYATKRLGADDVFDAFDLGMGKPLGGAMKLLFGAAQWISGTLLLTDFSEILGYYRMGDAPGWYVVAILLIGAIPAAWMGLESITRMSKVVIVLFLVSIVTTVIGTMSRYDTYRLYPLLGGGLGSILGRGLQSTLLWSDILILTTLTKPLQGVPSMRKAGGISIGLSVLIGVGMLFVVSLMFAYPVLRETPGAMFRLSGEIGSATSTGEFGELQMYLRLPVAIAAVTFSIYTAVRSVCLAFSIKSIRSLLPAGFVLAFYFCILAATKTAGFDKALLFMREWGFLALVVPVLAISVCAILCKKGVKGDAMPKGA